jgi:hypothetical protein
MTSQHSGNSGELPELPSHLGADFLKGLSASQFETPTQVLLRDGFAETVAENVEALAGFDPSTEDFDLWYLGLESTFPEADDAEPVLAERYRNKMLADLGLSFTSLEQDDPDFIFQYTYEDASTRQMRYITRADGARIVTEMLISQEGQMQYLALLTDRRAEENAWEYQAQVDDYNITAELANRLGVEDAYELIEQTKEMDLAEKIAMLEELRAAQAQSDSELGEQLVLNDQALNKARKRYVKAVMPALGLLETWRKPHQEARAVEYIAAVEHTAFALEMGPDQLEQHNALEQAKRHAELNKQLELRKRARILGTTAVASVVIAVPTAVVGAVGYFHEVLQNAPQGLAAGFLIGLGLSVPLVNRMREGLRHLSPFASRTTANTNAPLINQLAAEQEHAEVNSYNLSSH